MARSYVACTCDQRVLISDAMRRVRRPDVDLVCAQGSIDFGLVRHIGERQLDKLVGRFGNRRAHQRAQICCAIGALGMRQLYGRQQLGCTATLVERIDRQYFLTQPTALTMAELAEIHPRELAELEQHVAVQHHLTARLAAELDL